MDLFGQHVFIISWPNLPLPLNLLTARTWPLMSLIKRIWPLLYICHTWIITYLINWAGWGCTDPLLAERTINGTVGKINNLSDLLSNCKLIISLNFYLRLNREGSCYYIVLDRASKYLYYYFAELKFPGICRDYESMNYLIKVQ